MTMTPEKRLAVAKDLILFLGGLAGIAFQQITGETNIVLLIIFTAMTGVPGLTNLVSLLRGSVGVLESPSHPLRHSQLDSNTSSSQLDGSPEPVTE